MAEALAKKAPLQLDKTTYLTSGIFYSETKTLFYKYNSTIPLISEKMKPYIKRQMCSDPMRRAFMRRGIKYRHDYDTPTGLQSVTISIKDC